MGPLLPTSVSGCGWKKRRRLSKEQQHNEKWGVDMPLQPRAIALAADKLIIAGWLDAIAIRPRTGLPVNSKNPDPRNCVLRVLSTSDGSILGECEIPADPAYDSPERNCWHKPPAPVYNGRQQIR